jgi:hypothetical protein
VVKPSTEITVVGGDRFLVEGNPDEVERIIIGAARGSIMELAWLVEAETGERLGLNPDSLIMLRAAGS